MGKQASPKKPVSVAPARKGRPSSTPVSTARQPAPAKTGRVAAKQKAERPSSGRGVLTVEKLLQAAGEVLGETGFEKLTSNAICARAGLTPPAFYHYFADKYAVLEELADRLLKKQNDAFASWVKDSTPEGIPVPDLASLERLFAVLIEIASREPGGIWTIRALRALPHLSHVRLRWQRQYTDEICQAIQPSIPEDAWPLLWSRVRILVEFAYVVDELVYEEDRLSRATVVREAARLIHGNLRSIFEP